MRLTDTVLVAGADTLIGRALLRQLDRQGFSRVTDDVTERVNLRSCSDVDRMFQRDRISYVFLAGGRSGGIHTNINHPATLMADNVNIQGHVIQAAYKHGVNKLVFTASSCVYPKAASQPLNPASLLTGPLERTNEAYAVAKIAGLKMCEAYRSEHGVNFVTVIPADAFGVGDTFGEEDSHVVPALIRRMHEAKCTRAATVVVWGSGRAERDFVFADDVADGCIFAMRHYDGHAPLNIGSGGSVSIRDIASMIKDVVGYGGEIEFDRSRPDGMAVKRLDSSVINMLGWRPTTPLAVALQQTYTSWLTSLDRSAPPLSSPVVPG